MPGLRGRPGTATLGDGDRGPAQVRDLVTKGALGLACILITDDCRKTYQDLQARGVEFIQEPTEQPYGVDCALRDPFGNHVRISQPAAEVGEITEEVRQRWAAG